MTENFHVQYDKYKARALWRKEITVEFSDRGFKDLDAPNLIKLLEVAESGEMDDAVVLAGKIAVQLRKIGVQIPRSEYAPTFGVPAKLGRLLIDAGKLPELEIGFRNHFVILVADFLDAFPDIPRPRKSGTPVGI